MYQPYADTIIKDCSLYAALEIAGVCETEVPGSSGQTCCEVDNENPEFFSVYARLEFGEAECVGDFSAIADARSYASELSQRYGWPVFDLTACDKNREAA